MKGISPIIAIIIILLITIAIAGAAYAYISIVWGGMITEAVQITGQTCSTGRVTIYAKNIGTEALDATDFTIERAPTAFTTAPVVTPDPTPQGQGAIIQEAAADICGADTYCKYTLIVGGRVYRADVSC